MLWRRPSLSRGIVEACRRFRVCSATFEVCPSDGWRTSMKKLLVYLFVFALAVSCLASGTFAQTVQGVVTGVVTDPSGGSVPKATVTLINLGTNVSQATTTGDDGSYRFSLVPPGQYSLDV